MAAQRVTRLLSTFSHSTANWVPISSRLVLQDPIRPNTWPKFSITSWNINAFSSRPVARAAAILDHLLTCPSAKSDVIFLQEVTTAARNHLLHDARIRANFFTTDAEDTTAFSGVPFATMTLLSRASFAFDTTKKDGQVKSVTRFKLPSHFGRDALCTDVFLPMGMNSSALQPDDFSTQHLRYKRLRLLNLHLDSLWPNLHHRIAQMSIVAHIIHDMDDQQGECHSSVGLAAGDFNAIRPEDQKLIENNGLKDAWAQLFGDGPEFAGASWEPSKGKRGETGRLDRVAMTDGLEPLEMHLFRPGAIEVPMPGKEKSGEVCWSDHFGLRCTLRVRN